MLQIFAVPMKERMSKAAFNRLMDESSLERQAKARRFIKCEDAARSLIGERLAREVIARHTGMSVFDIRFEANKYGKPHVRDTREAIYFNLSHSAEWIVCAIDHWPVGIDVEQINPIDLQIANQFFSERECAQLMSLPSEQRLSYFFELWTMKESYIKADGRGLSIPLNSFTIQKNGATSAHITEERLSGYYFKLYDIDPAYKLAVCRMRAEFPESITIVELSSLLISVF
ncbi:4'-phosphopantetheinyl transferase family protein [Paenibacillus sp. PL91]|uniref:4'-phosphopantetheinyl transferase family protein n=1 Tax=Paenibacillus sp. PL91 TaxID=2729538 RepID=UPI00145F000E|nr:4'-phosphopantetheinyl transferase superfamily protein [Paenibacillus sp. PL91]MBC9200803.1 4'-phosphopantetheinyl transferase superfamily protein [Paenibacillus sp. PL91]